MGFTVAGSLSAVIGGVLIIVGIVLYCGTGGAYLPFTDYAIGIEVHSGESTVTLYKWHENKKVVENGSCLSRNGIDYNIENSGSLNHLLSCVQELASNVNSEHKIPVLLDASSALRLLSDGNITAEKSLLRNIDDSLKSLRENNSQLMFTKPKVVSDKDTALNAWIATNYIIKTDNSGEESNLTGKTAGILDMGGVSAQIAYEVDSKKSNSEANILGKDYFIQASSNLCYGIHQALNRYYSLLIKDFHPSNSSHSISETVATKKPHVNENHRNPHASEPMKLHNEENRQESSSISHQEEPTEKPHHESNKSEGSNYRNSEKPKLEPSNVYHHQEKPTENPHEESSKNESSNHNNTEKPKEEPSNVNHHQEKPTEKPHEESNKNESFNPHNAEKPKEEPSNVNHVQEKHTEKPHESNKHGNPNPRNEKNPKEQLSNVNIEKEKTTETPHNEENKSEKPTPPQSEEHIKKQSEHPENPEVAIPKKQHGNSKKHKHSQEHKPTKPSTGNEANEIHKEPVKKETPENTKKQMTPQDEALKNVIDEMEHSTTKAPKVKREAQDRPDVEADDKAIPDPCANDGVERKIKGSEILNEICVRNADGKPPTDHISANMEYRFVGINDPEKCRQYMTLLTSHNECRQNFDKCALDNIEVPKGAAFIAFSNYYKISRAIPELRESPSISLEKYKTGVKSFCSHSSSDLEKNHEKLCETNEENCKNYCFGLQFIERTLNDLYNFDVNDWSNILFTDKIHGIHLNWVLGDVLVASNKVPASAQTPPVLPMYGLILMLVVGVVLLGYGLANLYTTHSKRSSYESV